MLFIRETDIPPEEADLVPYQQPDEDQMLIELGVISPWDICD